MLVTLSGLPVSFDCVRVGGPESGTLNAENGGLVLGAGLKWMNDLEKSTLRRFLLADIVSPPDTFYIVIC